LTPEETSIIEMKWDPNEDNILVSFIDGSLCMVSFHGLCEQTEVCQTFEVSQNQVTQLEWYTDKSGNFITANEKLGVLQFWNVASKEPKQTYKVGSSGVHAMKMLSPVDSTPTNQRLLISL